MAKITRRGLFESGAIGALAATAGAGAATTNARAADAPRGANGARERYLLDFDWRFKLGHAADVAQDFKFGEFQRTYAKQGARVPAAADDFDFSDWAHVRLPHDWVIDLPFTPSAGTPPEWDPRADHGFKPIGREFPQNSVGWYRKSIDIPESDLGKRISLEFDGVFRDCLVIFNGFIVARNESGYAPFRIDVTDFVNYGAANTLIMRVDASLGEGWFYEGAGIYRHVWLVKTDPLHIPQWGVYVQATPGPGGRAIIVADVEVAHTDIATRDFTINAVVRDAAGVERCRMRGEGSANSYHLSKQMLEGGIEGARLWSLEDPHLYTMRTEIWEGGALIDAMETQFGLRTIRFDAEHGFFLNEQPVKLLGTCNHQDHAGVGSALPDALQYFRIKKLKEMGSNAYRTAHNPPTPELLDACDRLGMLVIDEARAMTSSPEGISQLERLVKRDRNHPSIILWSICNEEPLQGQVRGARVGASMRRAIERLDETRPLTAALDNSWGEGVSPVVDVLGFNYRTHLMEEYHQRVPGQPIIGSETASTVCTRGEYVRDDARHILPAYDTEHPWWATTSEFWWKIVAERPYIAGGFIWTGFDYRGEPTPFNQFPSISSFFGVYDTCGFPKDNFYYYKSWWMPNEHVLHLLPHWNWAGREGQEIAVWVHSNCDRVELFVNGVSAGAKTMERNSHLEWRVPYAPGAIEARGYKNGELVATSRRETTGAPARIVLRPDRTRMNAEGEDCVVVAAEVQDAHGRIVPIADNEIAFSIGGPARVIGVGNGNPNSLEADRASTRKAFNGLCMAIVQSSKRAGRVSVRAVSPGLSAGTCTITSVAAPARPAL